MAYIVGYCYIGTYTMFVGNTEQAFIPHRSTFLCINKLLRVEICVSIVGHSVTIDRLPKCHSEARGGNRSLGVVDIMTKTVTYWIKS